MRAGCCGCGVAAPRASPSPDCRPRTDRPDDGDRARLSLRGARRGRNLGRGEREAEMAETRIGVIGCAGRVGRMLIADIAATEGCVLSGGVARPGSAVVGQDLGELAGISRAGIAAFDDPERL